MTLTVEQARSPEQVAKRMATYKSNPRAGSPDEPHTLAWNIERLVAGKAVDGVNEFMASTISVWCGMFDLPEPKRKHMPVPPELDALLGLGRAAPNPSTDTKDCCVVGYRTVYEIRDAMQTCPTSQLFLGTHRECIEYIKQKEASA